MYDEEEQFVYPPCLPLSAQHLSSDGIYMMDAGEELLVLIGKSVPNIVIKQFIG